MYTAHRNGLQHLMIDQGELTVIWYYKLYNFTRRAKEYFSESFRCRIIIHWSCSWYNGIIVWMKDNAKLVWMQASTDVWNCWAACCLSLPAKTVELVNCVLLGEWLVLPTSVVMAAIHHMLITKARNWWNCSKSNFSCWMQLCNR